MGRWCDWRGHTARAASSQVGFAAGFVGTLQRDGPPGRCRRGGRTGASCWTTPGEGSHSPRCPFSWLVLAVSSQGSLFRGLLSFSWDREDAQGCQGATGRGVTLVPTAGCAVPTPRCRPLRCSTFGDHRKSGTAWSSKPLSTTPSKTGGCWQREVPSHPPGGFSHTHPFFSAPPQHGGGGLCRGTRPGDVRQQETHQQCLHDLCGAG